MLDDNSSPNGIGCGVLLLVPLQVILVWMKLTNTITSAWGWVLAPIWAPTALFLAFAVCVAISWVAAYMIGALLILVGMLSRKFYFRRRNRGYSK
jgi:hypothetical protein